uniref:DNA methyltransferase n=1 Tax=Trichothermofontia sichuanensis TaxID=3045816 RepID=UPI0036F3C759
MRFLTEPGDLVVDIFAGSNTTGFVAEQENRYWLAFEKELQYLAASSFRFMEEDANEDDIRLLYQRIIAGESQEIVHHSKQLRLFEPAKRYPA